MARGVSAGLHVHTEQEDGAILSLIIITFYKNEERK